MSTRKGEALASVFSARVRTLIGDESVSAFARRVGLKQASVDRYAKAVHSPNAEALIAIATNCGVTSDWLLGIEDRRMAGNPRAEAAESKLAAVKKSLIALVKEL